MYDAIRADRASATRWHCPVSPSTAPLGGAEPLIRIDMVNPAAGSQDCIGLDNIRFGQASPVGAIPRNPELRDSLLGLAERTAVHPVSAGLFRSI